MAASDSTERRLVNQHATAHVGKSEAGETYNVYTMDGAHIKETEVTPQGTLYVGQHYAGDEVRIEKA